MWLDKRTAQTESHSGGMTLLLRPLKKSTQLGNVGKIVVAKMNIYVLRKMSKELYTMLEEWLSR